MPKLVEPEKCCGCASCASKCPHDAIQMQPDKKGFLHPKINPTVCVECKACERVCPGLHPASNQNTELEVFLAQHKDDEIRYQSTSGGAFTALASYVIENNGIVFGAILKDNFEVVHGYVDSTEDLRKFRNSKYVQSEIGDTYRMVLYFLKKGRMVCFSGTPCQVNGLVKYLGKPYENLVTVDVVCKSVPSPLIFKKYVQFKKEQEKDIQDIVFRDKKRGFLYCTMSHYASKKDKENGNAIYRRGSESDEWLRLFLSGSISRECCFTCHYQTSKRVSDFTLGDIWQTNLLEFDDNKGTTLLHVWTPKGKEILNAITSTLRLHQYAIQKSRGVERKSIQHTSLNRQQKLFEDAKVLSPSEFFRRYAPYNFKTKLKNYIRWMLWRCNMQAFVRGIKHSIIHRK